jgi:hypothetical protein
MADYYARRVYQPGHDITFAGPFPNASAAHRNHLDAMMKDAEAMWVDKQTLLDVSSLHPHSEDELKDLLMHDVALKAIFEMGRHRGYTQAERHYKERYGEQV